MGWQPGYLRLLKNGSLAKRVVKAKEHFLNCRLCPRQCAVERSGQTGYCRAGQEAIVASFGPHFGEEKVLVGKRGSGTIFFAHCNLRCVYCQNHDLSFGGRGLATTSQELAAMMLLIQNRYRCPNVNLVTPTHFLPNILEAVYLAAKKGLGLPLVYNCGGYESVEALQLLDGVVDIYMPDFKYAEARRGQTYSQAKDYPQRAKEALLEMDRQVGGLELDERGLARKGLLIRHLMLPGGLADTKKVLRFIHGNLSPAILLNLMAQYYPSHQSHLYPEINRRLDPEDYGQALAFARDLGLRLA